MKKSVKILILLFLVAFLIADTSCRSHKKTCKGMKYHNSDVKRGLAH
ncbi:MAG: hypothetical protein WC868_06620 [Bacteroidales bacterium]